jgi:hypothetical protein
VLHLKHILIGISERNLTASPDHPISFEAVSYQTIPCAFIASATFRKPAMFAPAA